MGGPAARAGLKYGLISGVISLVITAFDIISATSQAWRSLGHLRGLIDLIFLPLVVYAILIPVFAGREAAMQTGIVSTGAVAGLVTCVVTTLVALPGGVVQSIVAPNINISLMPNTLFGGAPSVVRLVIGTAIAAGISLAVYALLGALGGLVGRRAYRRILSGYEAPSRRRVTSERIVPFGLALFLLVLGMCMLFTMSEH